MKKITFAILFGCVCLLQSLPAQNPPAQNAAAPQAPSEDQALSNALSEAGSSPIEFIRVLERHLERFPETPRRAEVERALVKAAMETKDDRRIILYGERVMCRDASDIQVVDRVTRALLATDAKETSERALIYARQYQSLLGKLRGQAAPAHFSPAQWLEEIDRGVARALVLEARATGNLGKTEAAVALAQSSWDAVPTAEQSRVFPRRCRDRPTSSILSSKERTAFALVKATMS